MKKFNKNLIVFVLAIALMLGFTGPIPAHAATATAPALGTAASYSVFGAAGITNSGASTNVWGDAGENGSGGDLLDSQVDGILYTIAQAIGIDITAAYGSLNAQTGATGISLSGTVTVTPGLYTVIPAETLNGTVTLDGAGVYVFRSSGAFTVAPNATMNLINGADACNVFWQIPTTMIIGSGAHVEGTIITESSHITLGTDATLKGRALSGAPGQVTLLSNIITEPTCTAPATTVRRSSSGSIPRVVVPVFQPTIDIISTPLVYVAPIIPMLPKTGFPPQESGTWYESLLNNILNLFR